MMVKWRAGLLGSGMVLAAVLCSAMPAQAAKKGLSSLTADPRFRTTITQIDADIKVGRLDAAGTALSALQPQGTLEKYLTASLAMKLAVKRNDMVAQRKAIAAILESGGAPEERLAYLNHVAGYLSYQTGATDNAIIYLTRALDLGSADPQASLLLAEIYVRQHKLDDAIKLVDATIAAQVKAGKPVPPSWYDRAASLSYQRKDWAAMARYNAAKLRDPSMGGPYWRGALTTFIEVAHPTKDAELDLYRLQAATGGLASERDYQGYAALANDKGFIGEAQAVIESGEANGQLSKSDPNVAKLQRVLAPKAVKYRASVQGMIGKAGSVASATKAMQAGDALLANSQYADAVPYYRAALAKGGIDRDQASMRLGIALARSGDFGGARQVLAEVGGSLAPVATYWAAWADTRAQGGLAEGNSDGQPHPDGAARKQVAQAVALHP